MLADLLPAESSRGNSSFGILYMLRDKNFKSVPLTTVADGDDGDARSCRRWR